MDRTRIGKGVYAFGTTREEVADLAADWGREAADEMKAAEADRPVWKTNKAALCAQIAASHALDFTETRERLEEPRDLDIHWARNRGGTACGRTEKTGGGLVSWTPVTKWVTCWSCLHVRRHDDEGKTRIDEIRKAAGLVT